MFRPVKSLLQSIPGFVLVFYTFGLSAYSFAFDSIGINAQFFRYIFVIFIGSLLLHLQSRDISFGYLFHNRYAAFLMAFMILWFASLIISTNYLIAQGRVSSILLMGVLPVVFILSLNEDRMILDVYVTLTLMGVLYSIAMLTTYRDSEISGNVRLSAMGINPIMIGRYIAMGLIFCLNWLSYLRGGGKILLLLGLMVFEIWALLLSGSRQVGLAILICYPAVKLLLWLGNLTRVNRIFSARELLFYATLVASVVAVFQLLPESLTWRFTMFMDDPVGEGATRSYLWHRALQHFGDSTVLTMLVGEGLGGFAEIMGYDEWPHNIVLELLVENGVIGVLLFFAFVLFIVRTGVRGYRKVAGVRQQMLSAAALMFFVLSLLVAQVSGNISANFTVWIAGALVFQVNRLMEVETSLPGMGSCP